MTTIKQFSQINRALEIAGEIAREKNLTVDQLRTTRRNREVNEARSAFSVRVRDELGWGVRMTGRFLNITPRSVCDLLAISKGRRRDLVTALRDEIARKDEVIRALERQLSAAESFR